MGRFKPSHPPVILALFVAVSLAVASWFSMPSKVPSVAVAPEAYADIAVSYVYDGDTIKLANGQKVRLVGIDTPESSENKKLFRDAGRSGRDVHEILEMGKRAAAYTRSLLNGRRVRLEFDIQRLDKYGRLLAYVYRVDDGLFINEAIIRNGFAYPMTIPPNIRHADEFKELFRQARRSRVGLWADFEE